MHVIFYQISVFQLTPSRRATLLLYLSCFPHKNFNSRPHGGRRGTAEHSRAHYYFNSRPHGGRLFREVQSPLPFFHFNSRPHGGRHGFRSLAVRHENFNSRPHGGRPLGSLSAKPFRGISTHALTEGDVVAVCLLCGNAYFNSRPHGGRQGSIPCT